MAENGMICGRPYHMKLAGNMSGGHRHNSSPRGKMRFIVEGINHPKAGPIRFKSAKAAERYIINMRLEVKPSTQRVAPAPAVAKQLPWVVGG